MDEDIYIVVSTSEDGAYIERITKTELLARLNNTEERYYTQPVRDADYLKGRIDLMERSGVYIIKGDLVVPHPKEKIVELWSVE